MSNGRAARRRLAAHDGDVIRLHACCDLELIVGATNLAAHHDDGCPALDPSTPAGLAARIAANDAIGAALASRGLRTVTVMVGDVDD